MSWGVYFLYTIYTMKGIKMSRYKQFEYKIERIEIDQYNAKWLTRQGDDGWQMIFSEDYQIDGTGYDSDSRKVAAKVTKRFVTFMREIVENPEHDAIGKTSSNGEQEC